MVSITGFQVEFRVRHWIDWQLSEVAGCDNVLQRMRSLLLVDDVLFDDAAYFGEVVFEHCFPCLPYHGLVLGNRNRHQGSSDNGDYDHQ
jgi:hypothetical protein